MLWVTIRATCPCAFSPECITDGRALVGQPADKYSGAAGGDDATLNPRANRLGANSLVSCVYVVSSPLRPRLNGPPTFSNGSNGSRIYDQETKRQQELNDKLIAQAERKPIPIRREVAASYHNVTVVRHNDRLKQTDDKLREFRSAATGSDQ
jgi:succinate dehydrogenase / fumarate reductase flavoprotein subunit